MPYLTQEEIDSGILDKFKNYDPAEVKKQHELAWNNSPGYQDLFEGKEQYDPGKVESPSGVVPDRGFVGDVSSNLARGAGDLVRMGGYALKTIDPDGGIGVLEKAGDKMIGASKYAEKNFDIMKMDESEASGEGFLSRGWKGGVRSAVPSVSPVVAGGLAGSVFGPVGALVGAGIGTLGLFGFGVYGEKRQEYIDQGIEEPEAEKAAFKQALIEGGIETAGSLIGLKIFGVDKFITQPLKQSLKELIETPLSTWGKKLATDTFLNEIPTEMLQEALGSQVETGLGLQDEGAWREAMVEAIVPAMVMSLGFGLGSQGLTMVNKRNLKNQINNLDDPKARLKAVEAIEKGILAHEKKGDDTGISNNAEAWSAMAMDRIEEGKPIELNTDFVTYATNGEDVLSAMRGKVGEGMSLEYRDKLTKRINNLSLFRSLTPRQKELREQYLIELANVDKEIASQQQNKTKTTDPAQQSQQNIIGPESDQFEQFQEGFRDQKIGEFEQNLNQAQAEINEYPAMAPIQPDIESLRKEWEDRKVQAEANAPATSRRQLIADESNTFDDFLYNIQSDTFENNLRSAQADIQQQPQQAPIQPDVEALRREYENKQAPVETESKLSRPQGMLYSQQQQPVVGPMPDSRQQEAKPELEPTTGMGLKDKGQQLFVDQRIQKLGSIDAVDKAYGRDDNVSQYARAKAREVFGQDVLVETVKPVEETMVNNTPNASEPSAPMGGTPPTVKENLTVAPGQAVTWKDKKGNTLSGELIRSQKEGGKLWVVKKADGKNTLIHEKNFYVVDKGASVESENIHDFDTMVKEAARWRGAAMNVAERVSGDKKKALAISRQTTKGDLDAYLMKKYNIDAVTARDVSNELTRKDIKPDKTASLDDFKNESWYSIGSNAIESGPEKKMVHDHSSTQVNLPAKEAGEILNFASRVSDSELYTDPNDSSYGREKEPHITVKYGLKTNDPNDVSSIIKDHPPIAAKMGKVSIFENDKYDVVKVDVDSPELSALNKKIEQEAEISLPKSESFDYTPHATIAYVKPGEGKKYVGDKTFDGKEITFDSLMVSTRDGKLHKIPLSGRGSQSPKNEPRSDLRPIDEPQNKRAKTTIEEVNDDRSQEDADRPGIQNLDQEDGETVPGGRDGVLAGNVEPETTGYDNVLGISSSEDVRGPEKPGSVEGDGIRSGMQYDGGVGRTAGSRDEQFGREAASGTGLDDNGPGGLGRHGGAGRPGDPDRVLENYHIEDPEALIGGTPKVRFKKNQKAIEVFNEVSNEGRRPTAEERDAMASYIGWGSFGQELFQGTFENPTYKDGWANEGEWLRSHLGKSAWESAQASIINAHYTDPPTVSAIWDIVKQLGFNGGRVLEPSMGIGNFFGLMPKGLKSNSDLTGIELDETTAGMAKMLYPEANIQQMGYQDSKTADGFYDIVLGNWPFAAQGPADRRYNKYHLTLHDYFFIKALDQVREGGLVVGITASGTMDKVGKMARLQMGKRADLVAAFRMPTGAFKKYAGTSVVADVIILQKRSEGATANHDAAWLANTVLGKAADGKEIKVNEYWTHKPENVLGNMTIGHGTTQGRDGMIVERQQGYEDVLNSLAERLPKNIITKRGQIDHVKYITNNTTERQNSVTIKDDGLYIVRGERLARLNDVLKYSVKDEKETEAREAELKSMVRIRERYGMLLDAERNSEKTAENHRDILNQLYKAFVKKYGNLNGSFALKHFARAEDPMAPAMAALEKNTGTKENPVYEPAKIFTQSTQRKKTEIKNPSISDAFVMTRNEVARVVDLEAIAKKAGTTPDAVKAELIKKDAVFETPAGTFEVKDIYLSGNVREKLREAKAAKEDGLDMDRNIKALEAVIPDDIPYFNIEATMGAAWIPSETYKQFITETANLPDANGIHITPSNNGWIVKFDDAGQIDSRQEVKTIWSTPGASFTKILRSAFTGQAITIKTKDEDGNEYVDKEMSTAANEKVGALREALKDWIWKDVDRRVDLEKHYNETMNAWATPAYDGSFLSFDGMMLQKGESEFNLRKHQVNAIWRGVANGRGLYAHEVGTGKTFTMGGIAVESRRYGLAKKPLILGHNANSASVADDIQSMYPGAKVLYIDNLTPKTIDQKLYQIANDDWDAVVLPHSLLDRLTLSRETLDRLAQDEIMSLEEEAIASAAEEGFDIEKILDDEEALRKIRGATTAKEMVKQRNRIIQNIERQAQAASREGAIPFESLGIDMLIVDEVHEFKKPPLSTKMKVKGLNTTASGRSIGLNFLASYIKEQNNGKGVHIFTGTPITNTLNEIYNHMRYVMSSEMEKADVLSWDSWFNTFASVESDIERTSSGEYEMVSRLSGFHNVSELRKFAGQYMDIVFAEDMPEFVPRKTKSGKDLHSNDLTDAEREELVNGRVDEGSPSGRPYKKLVNEVADMSEEQRGILQTLVDRAKSFKDASGKERREIMLSGDPRNPVIIETDAAKAGFDPRLYDKELSDHPQNKINRCVNNVLKHYQEHEKASQVIFMEKGYNDQATRSKRDGAGEKATFKVDTFNAAQDLKRKLIEGGIPAGQIAIVNGSVDKKKRMEIANKVNSGEVRVVIGLTSTLGTGTNMQENLRAMHHLDAPWMPGELEQRNGRGHRQGNRWNTVLEYRYITESIDARRWQVLAKKQKMITDFLKAKEGVRSIEGDAVDLSSSDLDEINSSFSEAAGDARILIREKLKKDIEKLERKKRTHSQGVVDAKNRIKDIEGRRLPNLKDKVNGLKSDIEHYQSASKEPWAITIDGKKYTKRQEANVALEKLSLKLSTRGLRLAEKKKIGAYRGFDIMVSGSVGNGNTYSMERDLSYPIKPATGSIDFLTRSFPSMLDNTMGQVEEETSALDKFKQVAKEPFAQEKALQSKKESLDQLERDLESNPDAPPSWLAQGAPVGTDVYYKGEKWEVDGHRKGEHGHYVIIKQGENQEVVDYLEVMDENNMPVYETLDGDSGAKYSTSTDATAKPQDQGISQIDKAPGQGTTIDQIKSQYKNQQITTNPDGTLSILFKNGNGIRVKTVDHIGGDDIRFAMESGRMDKRGVILGKYQDGTVTINKTVANMETAIHENVHALKALGMITQADEKTLNNLTKLLQSQKKYRYEIQEDMEENQANTLAQLVADRANYREGSNVHALIQKIADFFDALFHIGRQSARKLAREYESGKIYSRDTNDKAESIPRFQAAGNTDSEAFKKWFGKSVGKTKDEKPVVFYHGTPNQFTVFEDRAGQSTTHTASGLGHFFTMDKAYANAYAKGSGNVMQVYLKMEKPYMMSLDEAQSFDTVTDAVVKKRRLKLKGYDSVIITVPGAMPMIVVFNPNQIKSVANQGAWNPDNPDIRYSASSDAATMKEHVSAYNQIAAGLKNVISNRKNKGQNYKQDIGVLENTLGLMSHYSEKIPAMKRTFDELMKRPEWKFEKENELSKNGEESMIGTMEDLKKHNKGSYDILKDYLIDNDINQVGAVIFQDEDGTWTIKSEKDKKTGKRTVLEEGIATKQEARALVIEYEVDAYPDPSGSDALRAFRIMTSNLHDFYAESWEAIIKDYEDRGLTLPQVVTKTKSGDVRIDLKVALAQMGDRSSYYFPRQRSNGDWQVYGKKQGRNDFVDYRDNKVTADYLAGKMKAQGYDVEVKKIGSMSEDIYQSVKNILATQAMVNQALNETKLDAKQRTLEDIGLSGEWRGQDYFIPNGGVYEWSSSVLKDLGGMEYSDRGKDGRSWSPGYWFEKAPKDIEELVTNALYISRGQETDISFEISQSLANQLSDTLRARGSRARMIARSDAVGKDVPIGYETDPVSAIAQAVNAAAGGYAKQQVAMNTSKAITGQHYTWEEWQKQHQDYDALVNAEDELSALTKNSETEEERIADIDREIKDLHREGAGVATESEKARQDRLLRIGKLFREKEKIRKWEDDKQAAKLHQDIARLRSNIHKEYRAYIQDNMLDPKKQKRAYDDAVNAVENVLKNDEAGDRVINTLKGLASVWFLGGRLSSAAINLTAMGTTVPAAMDAYGGIPLQRTMKHIAKAGKAYASFVTGKGNVSQEDRLILEDIFSRGWVAAQLNMETVNALKSGPAKKYGRAVELLMIPFKLTEEFNRGTTILAAYKGIMAENPGMSREDALLKAKKVSDRAHGIYGVENQPALLRKGRGLRAASAMYIFQTYMHNYLTTLAYMIGRKQAKAATYMILSPMVFGGAASSLLMPALKMIFKALDEDDPEEKIYQIAEELFGETGGDIARYGLPGLAGVSFKGSLAPNMPDFQEPLDALGPIGGMMRNIYDGAVNITQGDYLKGIEKISPLAIGNVAKAYRESTQGVTTRAGDPVFFGNKQIKGDFGTVLMRAAGMNPTKISKPREIQWHETELKQQYAERKRNIYSRIVRYHAQPGSEKNPDEWKEIIMEIKEFNARVKSNGFNDVMPLITHKTIKARVKRAFRPNKRERLRDDM